MSTGNDAPAARQPDRDRLGLSQQTFLLHAIVVVVVVIAGVAVAIVVSDRSAKRAAEERVLSVARTVASMPDVARAIDGDDPSDVLQPLAERARVASGMSFIVVMDTDGTRYSHPNPDNIGRTFIGTIDPAAEGGIVVETFEGTLGRSVRAVVPIVTDDADGPVGLVSVGVLIDGVGEPVRRAIPVLVGGAAAALIVAACGSWLIARRLRRQTLGLGPRELAGLYAHHHAVLHAVREGLIVFDPDGHIALANDEARRLLTSVGGHDGETADETAGDELPLGESLERRVAAGDPVTDELHIVGDRIVVVSQAPVTRDDGKGRSLGTVVTMRDHTELMALTDELSATRSLADSLRAQAHEAANQLHTVVTLVEMGDTDAAVRFATAQVNTAQRLTDRLVEAIAEPTLAALLLGKASQAHERAIELVVSDDTSMSDCDVSATDLVTVAGNLIDNAIDATRDTTPPRRVEVTIRTDDRHLTIRVRDTGPGLTDEALERLFEPGWSTKPVDREHRHGRGVGMALVRQVVRRHGGTIDVVPSDRGDNDGFTGACVTVRLPAATEAAPPEPEPVEPPAVPAPPAPLPAAGAKGTER